MRGMQRMTFLRDVAILSVCGVGGGSLIYANTLYEPLEAFYRDRSGPASPIGSVSSRPTTTRRSACSA